MMGRSLRNGERMTEVVQCSGVIITRGRGFGYPAMDVVYCGKVVTPFTCHLRWHQREEL
jgi:hypothetical protein